MSILSRGSTWVSHFQIVTALVGLEILAAFPAAVVSAQPYVPDVAQAQVATTALTIVLGQAELRRYSREPGTVIVGDATIAAASIATSDILVLTGLQPGATNVIVLDDTGAAIDHIMLNVVEPGQLIVVRRGQERQLLRCDPTCAPIGEPSLAIPALRSVETPQDADVLAPGEVAPPT